MWWLHAALPFFHIIAFTLVSSVFAYLDLCVPGMHPLRLQYPNSQPTVDAYKTMLPLLVQNGLILCVFSPICGTAYSALGVKLEYEGLLWLLFDVAVMAFVYDAWFYFTHRLFHHPWLYKYTHKVPPWLEPHDKLTLTLAQIMKVHHEFPLRVSCRFDYHCRMDERVEVHTHKFLPVVHTDLFIAVEGTSEWRYTPRIFARGFI